MRKSIVTPRPTRSALCLLLSSLLLASTMAATASAQDVPGAPVPAIAGTGEQQSEASDALRPGEFEWLPAAQRPTATPLMIIVNLREQRAYVYRDGERIAITTVSTGRPGRETPTGTFEILQKEKVHRSSLYDDAPMPFMQRLTWDGEALHAGRIPGHPASHGCVRLPAKFAEQLYELTERGETVVVSEDGSFDALARAGLDPQRALQVTTSPSLYDDLGAATQGEPLAARGDEGEPGSVGNSNATGTAFAR